MNGVDPHPPCIMQSWPGASPGSCGQSIAIILAARSVTLPAARAAFSSPQSRGERATLTRLGKLGFRGKERGNLEERIDSTFPLLCDSMYAIVIVRVEESTLLEVGTCHQGSVGQGGQEPCNAGIPQV